MPDLTRRLPRMALRRSEGVPLWPPYAVLALISYVPLLLSRPGMILGDTSDLLTIDPSAALASAASRWRANASFGAIFDRTNDPAIPMSPYFWVTHLIGMPGWLAQRLWLGSLLFVAGLGVAALLRAMHWEGEGWMLAVLAYLACPYVLSQMSVQSATLVAWCALPWLVAATARAVEAPPSVPWRWPARIGLVVGLAAGASPSAFLAILPAPVLWILYSVLATREVPWRRAANVAVRSAAASLAVSAWWLVGWLQRPRVEIDALREHFPNAVVAATSTPSETIRGLGDSTLYGGRGGALVDVGVAYRTIPVLVLVSFVPVAIALLAFCRHRFHNRVYFVGLFATGLVLSVGSAPSNRPEALGRILRAMTSTSAGSLLLPSTRAVPMIALAVAVGFASGMRYLIETVPDRGSALKLGGAALILASVPAYVSGHALDGPRVRDEVPAYWKEAAAALNDASHSGYGVLELPGLPKPDYPWGHTVEPVSYSLIHRPVALHTGGLPTQTATADLLAAIDEKMSAPDSLAPSAVAPLARLLGVDTILLRVDDPARADLTNQLEALLDSAKPGITRETSFPANDPQAKLIVYTVVDRVPLTRLVPVSRTVVVSGSGAGVVDLANRGLLTGDEAILYSATIGPREFAADPSAPVFVTDSSRWTPVQGVGLDALHSAISTAQGSARIIRSDGPAPFPTSRDNVYASLRFPGDVSVTSTAYGSDASVLPQFRPAAAFDGDPTTAWIAGIDGNPVGATLEVGYPADHPATASSITLVQPPLPAGTSPDELHTREVTAVRITVDKEVLTVPLDDPNHDPAGRTIQLNRPAGAAPWTSLQIAIESVSAPGKGPLGAGFAEVRFDGSPAPERVVLPNDVSRFAELSDHKLTFAFTRWTAPGSNQGEPRMVRSFSLSSDRTFSVAATIATQDRSGTPTSCAASLLSIDGHAVTLAFGRAERETQTATASGITLAAGDHELETASAACGATIDELTLSEGDGAVAGPPAPAQTFKVDQRTGTSLQITVSPPGVDVADPAVWLLTGSSYDTDWTGGSPVETSSTQLLNGYSTGWLLRPHTAAQTRGSFVFSARWTPQRPVNVGVIASFVVALFLVAMALVPGRRRPAPEAPTTDLIRAGNPNIVVLGVLGVFGIAAGPLPAIIGGAAALVLEQWPRFHRRASWSALGLLAVAAAGKAAYAAFGTPSSVLAWPGGTPWVDQLLWIAVAIALTAALTNTERPPVRRYL